MLIIRCDSDHWCMPNVNQLSHKAADNIIIYSI